MDRASLLAKLAKPRATAVPAPELGEEAVLYVRPITIRGMAAVRAAGDDAVGQLRATLADCVCDQDGAPLFAGEAAGEVDSIPAMLAQRLSEAAGKVSGFASEESPRALAGN